MGSHTKNCHAKCPEWHACPLFFCQNLHEELPCKSTQKWHDYPFRFTIKTKPVFHYKIGFRNSHFTLHTCSCFSCKTPNLAGDPAPGCTSLLTAHWSRLAKWSNTNKYTHCEGSHLKHKCSLIHSDENFIIVWVFLMKIPRLLEDFLDINRAVFVCVRIRNSIVTSCSIKLSAVLLIACHFCHEVRNLPLAPKAKRRGSCLWMYGKKKKKKKKKKHVIPIILDEVAHKIRVSVTVQVWLMPVNNIPWKPLKTPMLFLMKTHAN